MALWGTEDTLEGKPKIFGRSLLATGITNDPRAKVYATTSGWVYPPVKVGGQPETLVAIRGLSTRTGVVTGFAAGGLAAATLTSINWNITSYTAAVAGTHAAGTALSVSANFNEAVTVTGNPTFAVVNDSRTNHVLLYRSADSTANRVTFALEIGASHSSLQATDVLTIVADAISLAGGAIYDTVSGAGTAAVYANHVDIGTAAGSITVT